MLERHLHCKRVAHLHNSTGGEAWGLRRQEVLADCCRRAGKLACLQRVGTSAQSFRGQEVSETRAVNRLGRAAVRRCSSAVHGGVCCVSAKPVQCSTACSPRMHARGHVAVLRQPQAVPAANHVTPMSGYAHVYMRPPYTAELGHRAKVSARPSTLL